MISIKPYLESKHGTSSSLQTLYFTKFSRADIFPTTIFSMLLWAQNLPMVRLPFYMVESYYQKDCSGTLVKATLKPLRISGFRQTHPEPCPLRISIKMYGLKSYDHKNNGTWNHFKEPPSQIEMRLFRSTYLIISDKKNWFLSPLNWDIG